MNPYRRSRLAFVGTLAISLATACQASPPDMLAVAGSPAPSPTTPAAAAPSATPSTAPHTGVAGVADLNGQAFAGADVKVFQLGKKDPLTAGKTASDGSFMFDLGNRVAAGAPLKMIVSKDGKTLASLGPAGIVASGGGNIVAAGAGNIVASGAGNIVASGGGNIVAQGGGNIVAQGAGNRHLLVSDNLVYKVTVSTTLAVSLLQARLDAAGVAGVTPDGNPLEDVLDKVVLAYANLERVAAQVLNTLPNAADQVTTTLDANGQGKPSEQLAQQLTANPTLAGAFQQAAKDLVTAITDAVTAGGTRPPAETLGPITIGNVTVEAVPPLPESPTTTGQQSTTTTTTTTSTSTTTTTNTTTSGGGSSGGSSGGGSDGASGATINVSQGATVTLDGNLAQPAYSPTPPPL